MEKLFRIDVPDRSTNESFCSGSADEISDTNEIVYAASSVCPSCLSTFNSKSVKLFTSDGSSITDQVDEDLLLTTTLKRSN